MIPFNVPKKSRVFPGERLVAIVTPSFIRVTFLLRCMDLEMGPDSGCAGVAEAIQHWSGLGVAIIFFSISIAAILVILTHKTMETADTSLPSLPSSIRTCAWVQSM